MTGEIYTVEAMGFFFQFLPCALLCFVPFDDDRLKVKKLYIYICLTAGALIAAALFPVAIRLPFVKTYTTLTLMADIYMLITIAMASTAYGLLVREHYTKKLLVIYVVILYAAVVYWLANFLVVFVEPVFPNWAEGYMKVYTPANLGYYMGSWVTLFPLFIIFFRSHASGFLHEIEPERMAREFQYASVSTAGFLILMVFAHALKDVYRYDILGNGILLFLVLNQGLLYFMIFNSAVNRSREENALRAVEAQKLQYDRIQSDMERAARLRHDMRHHWNYLHSLAEEGDTDKLREYLSSLAQQTEHLENEVFCQDPTVNALLRYYADRARDDGVECNIAASCGVLNIKPQDLTVIIGNVMENALSSCAKFPGERVIDVAAGYFHGAFTLEVTNSCSGVKLARGFTPDSQGFLPAAAFQTTRSGGGHGLAAVSDLTKTYSGSTGFKFSKDNNTFTARVILPTE